MQNILSLGSICRYLRTIAWATQELWSHIVLSISDEPSRSTAQILGMVSWLERSGSCPISIRMQYATTHNQESDAPKRTSNIPLAAMEAIQAHSSQWEELCLALPSECYTSFFEHARTHDMPLLKRLTLLFHSAWPTNYILFASHPLTTAPLLSDVSLINMPVQSSMLVLPWGQITRFRGNHLNLADALGVLDLAPLETYALTWPLGYPTVEAANFHPHLRTLTLEKNVTALKYLTLPALEVLCIKTHRTFPAEQCCQLLLRSRCTLRSLEISVDFMAATALVSCLEAAPQLKELKVYNRQDRIHTLFGSYMAQCLTLRAEKSALIPQLQCLEVSGCSCQFDIESLAAMLMSRWDYCLMEKVAASQGILVGRLECFRLETSLEAPSMISEDLMHHPQIWRLNEEGMDIQVLV